MQIWQLRWNSFYSGVQEFSIQLQESVKMVGVFSKNNYVVSESEERFRNEPHQSDANIDTTNKSSK